VKADKTGYVKL